MLVHATLDGALSMYDLCKTLNSSVYKQNSRLFPKLKLSHKMPTSCEDQKKNLLAGVDIIFTHIEALKENIGQQLVKNGLA